MSIQTVTLIGADGNLGPSILSALVSHGFKVQVVKRESSKSSDSYPGTGDVRVTRIPDAFPPDALRAAFQGQDAAIVSFRASDVAAQVSYARAAAEAGVRRFIPADFGSCDSSSDWTQTTVPLFKRKSAIRAELANLVREFPGFSWTSVVCGHFADWSLEFLHVYLTDRKADVLDDGNTPFSLSTLERIGEATARILGDKALEASRNKMLFVQSFSTTQRELISAFEHATGEKWEANVVDAKKYEQEEKRKQDAGDAEATENLVWLLGTLDGDWRKRDGFAMELLGLEDEPVSDVVTKIVKDAKA